MTHLKYIDIAKGWLILCLCFCHFGQAQSLNGATYWAGITSWHYLFAVFFMQAFFFITGYCTNYDIDGLIFLKKQLKTLAIPAFLFTILNRVLLWGGNGFNMDNLGEELLHGVGFWFLWALLFSKLFYFICSKLIRKQILLFILFLGLILLGYYSILNKLPNILYHQQILTMSFFLFIGNYMRTHDRLYKELCLRFAWGGYVALMFAITLLHIPYSIISGACMVGSYKELPIYLITAISGTFFILSVSKFTKRLTILEDGGKCSLCIYGIHYPILCLLCWISRFIIRTHPDDIYVTFVNYISICLLTFWLSLLIAKYMKKRKIFRYFLGI